MKPEANTPRMRSALRKGLEGLAARDAARRNELAVMSARISVLEKKSADVDRKIIDLIGADDEEITARVAELRAEIAKAAEAPKVRPPCRGEHGATVTLYMLTRKETTQITHALSKVAETMGLAATFTIFPSEATDTFALTVYMERT